MKSALLLYYMAFLFALCITFFQSCIALHFASLLSCTTVSFIQAMASHVRSSLQQVIDTLLWIQTTDEEQVAVALSRLPVNERRNLLSRIQDAVYTSHSHAAGTAEVEATYLDSPAFRQEPPVHSTRSWAVMSETNPLPSAAEPSTTLHSDQQQAPPAPPLDTIQEHNRAREANAGQERKLGHCNVQQLALIGCRE